MPVSLRPCVLAFLSFLGTVDNIKLFFSGADPLCLPQSHL